MDAKGSGYKDGCNVKILETWRADGCKSFQKHVVEMGGNVKVSGNM